MDNDELNEREKLVQIQTCFSKLTPEQCKELAKLMSEEKFLAGEDIVKEGDLVDRVFIIVSGDAEVSKKVDDPDFPDTKIPLAVLKPSDTIGLCDTGFFSTTGKRTATVTALTTMQLLSLSIQELHTFLNDHPNAAGMWNLYL